MKLLLQLQWGQIRRSPTRYLMTTLAIVASAAVVIWVVSGYDALVSQFDDFAEEYLGRYHLVVAPAESASRSSSAVPLPAGLISELAGDPAVAALDVETHIRPGRVEAVTTTAGDDAAPQRRRGRGSPRGAGRRGRGGGENRPHPTDGERTGPPGHSGRPNGQGSRRAGRPWFPPRPTVVGTAAPQPPYPMAEGRWIDASADQPEAAISHRTAGQLGVTVGDRLKLVVDDRELVVPIVGIVQQVRELRVEGRRGSVSPGRGPATSAVYVSPDLAGELLGDTPNVHIAQIVLEEGTDRSVFLTRWDERLGAASPPLQLMTVDDIEEELSASRAAAGARNQAYSATGIALLAALFIIFTALSMGVDERSRQFAVMRAVSLTRAQIGALILLESLLLGTIGWLGGLTAGWGLLQVAARANPQLFGSGVALGPWGIGLSAACAFGGAIAAAIVPAWRAMTISPLEALSARSARPPARWSGLVTVAGLLLITINPLLVFGLSMPDDARYGVYVAIGCSTMAIGFVLLTPAVIRVTERLLGPVIARLLRLDPRLVATELSSNLWRTLGTCVALTLGLGLFVSTQIWGYSMLQPFEPGRWVPDLLINFTTGGLPDDEFANVASIAGIESEQCLPLAVEQAKLAEDITGSSERTTVARQDNVIVIGLDPQRGLLGPDRLLPLEFVAGTAESAAEMMRTGRGGIVPDHFARETGLGIGDTFEVLPPEAPEQPVAYAIAGIVRMPGWHWMTKFSGLRRRSGRSAAMVFADFGTVRDDFALERINFFWTALQPDGSLDRIGPALQEIAARHPGEEQPVNFQGKWDFAAVNVGNTVRLTTPQFVRNRIRSRADGMIWGMSQLPLVTLAVAGLGVLNTVITSVRARIWNIGVMRSIGLTRWGLARLILAESLLIGGVACLLSLAFGVMAGWCGAGISQYVSFFGGLNTSLQIPWGHIAIGFGATLLLCLAAAVWPAFRVCRQDPLQLLQAGRSSI